LVSELAKLNRSSMNNKKLIRFSESFLVLPIITMLMPFGNIPTDLNNGVIIQAPQSVLSQKQNIVAQSLLALNQVNDEKAKTLQKEADAVDSYFKENDMPLEGEGMKMVKEADKNGLDWRLLPAISAIESTGGKHACKNAAHSFMGWGSCKISFKSDDEDIEVVAQNLGGNDPDTEQHYAGKTTKEILEKYNPPYIVPHYADKVMKVMDQIGDSSIVDTSNA